jgi:voltage-gated potassium channel
MSGLTSGLGFSLDKPSAADVPGSRGSLVARVTNGPTDLERMRHGGPVMPQDNNVDRAVAVMLPFARRILRRRMSFAQALGAAVTVTGTALLTGAAAVTRTDPEQFPNFGVGVWWAATTVTTVGYGDVVPSSPAGRFVGGVLMFVGIASLALLTAIAASAIVVGEAHSEERKLEGGEVQILSELRELARRMDRLERRLDEVVHRGSRKRNSSQ